MAVIVVAGKLLLPDALLLMRKGKQAYTHLHCPACHEEFGYEASKEGKPCPACDNRDALLVPTIGSVNDGGGGVSGKVLTFLFVSAVLLQGTAYVGVSRWRRLRALETAALRLPISCSCPYCRRRIRYTAGKVGSSVPCPGCKNMLVLPPGPERAQGV